MHLPCNRQFNYRCFQGSKEKKLRDIQWPDEQHLRDVVDILAANQEAALNTILAANQEAALNTINRHVIGYTKTYYRYQNIWRKKI